MQISCVSPQTISQIALIFIPIRVIADELAGVFVVFPTGPSIHVTVALKVYACTGDKRHLGILDTYRA